MTAKSKWLNTKTVIHPELEKPCVKLRYCPYGGLVEEYGFSANDRDAKTIDKDKHYTKLSCANINGAIIQFGHDCPVHYLAEGVEPVKPKPKKKTRSRNSLNIWGG